MWNAETFVKKKLILEKKTKEMLYKKKKKTKNVTYKCLILLHYLKTLNKLSEPI